jgi:hypothetical protein
MISRNKAVMIDMMSGNTIGVAVYRYSYFLWRDMHYSQTDVGMRGGIFLVFVVFQYSQIQFSTVIFAQSVIAALCMMIAQSIRIIMQ